ncbi:UvrD-helicase domain-containing protein, partial [Sharpea azabuensis]|uniref:UvrD-helicase domain-containing protein n=1 Tax=Sharpea azabuensis TaxID=322505 RepID=UPI003D059570
MASMVGNEPQKYYGEKKVWQALKVGLPDDYIVYHNKEINGYEFDFCIAIPDRGIIVIEVKGWQNKPINIINNTIEIDGIKFKNPKEQARGYRFNLLNKIESQFGVKPLVEDMVCYPFISEEEYKSKRLDIFSAPEFTIFKEDLQDSTKLRKKIDERLLKAGNQVAHAHFDEELFNKFRSLFEANIAVKSNSREHYSILYTIYKLSAEKEKFLVHSYFLGTKEILFFAEEESAKHFVNQINVASKERNIQLAADAIKIGYEKDLEIKNNQLNVFNLQLFVVSNLRDIVSEELEINDGFLDSYEHVLDELQKKCNFNLNQYKLEHADAESNIQVTAGAGTGKTYSMVSRVAYLCNKLSEPITDLVEQLGMVTFTNDATNNMKIRLKQMFENYFVLTKNSYYLKFIEDVDRARISTIHSFIIQILREGSFYTGLGSNFSLTSNEFRRKEIYREYLRKYIDEKDENEDFSGHLPIPTYELIDILIKIANKLQDKSIDLRYLKEENLGRVMDSPMPYFNEFFINVIKPSEQQYLEEARQNNSLNLRECIAYFNQLLESNPEILSKLKLRYLFIDEFQDTDDVQIELLQRIQRCIKTNKVKCKFFVVGDLKQSIYRFRGATMSAFDQLKKNSELSWKEFNLNTNYRTDAR